MKMTLILIALLFTASVAFAVGMPQTHCPVMTSNAVDKDSPYVDVEGYRIYVCCSGCAGVIKSDPGKYIQQMKDEGVELEKTPVKAPAVVE